MTKINLNKKQIWRLCDLAMRRMIDNGVENYDEYDQKLFEKIQSLKESVYHGL